MQEYISSIELCKTLATELKNDDLFRSLAEENYDKGWTIEIGFDRLRQDWKKVSPFVVLLPQSEEAGSDGFTTYSIGALLGVVDNSIDNQDISLLQGLDFLSNKAFPQAFSVISKASDSLPTMSFTNYDCEFEQEGFPLVYCNIALTFTMRTAIGTRRW